MNEQRFGAGGVPLRPKEVVVTPEEPKAVEAPVVEYTTTVTETDSEDLPEIVEDNTETLSVGSSE
jgi:hypothetical protein|tara:strand:- start:559 stop:753 length:195 start_codon:yes stop_codon:yes gene_type:complete